jgi:NHLM bacteriocin system ABC transporter ATP-binding protein
MGAPERRESEVPSAPAERLLGADRPLFLLGTAVWMVRSGYVDVFVVPVQAGEVSGPRAHLARIGVGSILGDAPPDSGWPDGHVLQAVGGANAIVDRVAWHDFWCSGTGSGPPPLALVNAWIASFCRACSVPGNGAERDLPLHGRIELQRGERVQPRNGVLWTQVESGSLELWSISGLVVPEGSTLPVSSTAWLEAREAATLRVVPDPAALPPDAAARALSQLHVLGLQVLQTRLVQAELRHSQRQRQRLGSQQRELASSLVALTAPLARKWQAASLDGSPDREEEALLQAARLVAGSLGIEVTAARVAAGMSARQALRAIATSSRIRIRRVALRDRWWCSDNGPLLGFTADGHRPVALLPDGPRRYIGHESGVGRPAPVDAAAAGRLAPAAYTFYRPLPAMSVTVKELCRFAVRGCRGDLLLVVALGGAMSVLGLFTPLAMGLIFNSVVPSAERAQVLQLGFIMAVCAVCTALLQAARAIALVRLDTRMAASIQAAVWDRLLTLPTQFFQRYPAGDLAVRVSGIDAVRQALSGAAMRAILMAILALANFALLFHYSVSLAVTAVLLALAAVAVIVSIAYRQLRHYREVSRLRANVSGVVLQFLTGISKIRVAGAEMQAFARWARLFARQRDAHFRHAMLSNQYSVASACFSVIALAWLFVSGVGDVQRNAMRVGDFVAFIAAFSTSLSATLSTGMALLSVMSAIPQYELARPILETEPEVVATKADPGELTGEIAIDHLTFRYALDRPPALDDLSLRIRPGQFVAFVGPSGSGKSTLLRLLLGFEKPAAGSIYYDGQDLQELDIRLVRRQIGVVLQAGHVTPGDIYTQIVGSTAATLDDAWEAARIAGLDDDIRRMPMGMHTIISEGGTTFSGGQRQRLMIARAVVGRPRMLFLDEATSALDNQTQSRVSQSLESLRATRLVVAHRLSTIIRADRIYVISGGRILQTGTYEELVRDETGLFAELVRRQLS